MASVPDPTLTPARIVGVPELVKATLLAPELLRVIAPRKTLALFKVMALPPVIETAPAPAVWVMAPVSVSAPVELMVSVPLPNAVAASEVAVLLLNTTLEPVEAKVTVPRILFVALFRLMVLVPALMVTAPAPVWEMAPVCEIAWVVELMASVPEPTLELANISGDVLFVKATLLAPELLSETAPVKLLAALFKVITAFPVVNDAVPGTVNAPLWVIAPPAINTILPLECSVVAGRAMAALSNCSVRLRKLVNVESVGAVAAAFTLRISTSRMLVSVPAKETAPVKLFAAVSSRISLLAAVDVKEVVPGTVKMPVSEILPAEVRVKLLPTVDVAKVSGALFTNCTALAPELLSETAPVKLLAALVRVMSPELVVKVA